MGAQQSSAGAEAAAGGQASSGIPSESLPLYTLADVALHRSPGDAWMVLHGGVYDVTSFLRAHPGGLDVLLDAAGTDATAAFERAEHPQYAREDMQQYLVGRLDQRPAAGQAAAVAPVEAETEAAAASAAPAQAAAAASASSRPVSRVKIVYGSQRGAGQRFAERLGDSCRALSASLSASTLAVAVQSMAEIDPEDLAKEQFVVFVVSTYTDGLAPDSAKFFCEWLEEATVDFRVGPEFMSKVCYAVLGLGNSLYEQHYNTVAKSMARQLPLLGGTPLCPLGLVDDSISRNDVLTAEDDYQTWADEVFLPNLVLAIEQPKAFELKAKVERNKAKTAARAAKRLARREADRARAREAKAQEADATAQAALEREQDDGEESASDGEGAPEAGSDGEDDAEGEGEGDDGDEDDAEKVVDLEELGAVLTKSKLAASASSSSTAAVKSSDAAAKPAGSRPMLTDTLRKNLSKQGYKLIGTHSGVKLCRWTKAMLRGRGGCYKHTMYGIASHLCMEMTPSLACANKCVFCWRTHTNPVGKEWKWQVDEPRMIIDAAIANHRTMINTMKGVPGVKPERLEEAQKPKHCALSLVGEPIMYPHINQFVRMLHEENISSFLVTNAQFPKEMRAMDPVCQLYVSIDASTADSLKAVDRPLFSDYWERFQSCLEAIRHKQQRTVYRLTLVKTFNMNEVIEYAKLIAIGKPTFIEIKGVTFCGSSGAGSITMKDVPLHQEVKSFAESICKYLEGSYEMASEHEHSCCVLISDTKMKKDGKWHTWIDYPKFNALVREYYATGKTFSAEDYSAETPSWAVYGAAEAGFNPVESKTLRKKARPTLEQLEQRFPGINQENEQKQQAGIKAHLEAQANAAATRSGDSTALSADDSQVK